MFLTLLQPAAVDTNGFVPTALAICLVAGWLVAGLLRQTASARSAHGFAWLGVTALVAGLGVWTTHFIAMLGYRPDAGLGYDGRTTAASAMVAVVGVGVPLAASGYAASRRWRTVLGGLSGAGIAATHYCGMLALQGCLQSYGTRSAVLSGLVGVAGLGAARGVGRFARSKATTCLLFTAAVCGTHFTALASMTPTLVEHGGAKVFDNIVHGMFAAVGAALLFFGAFATVLTTR